MALACHCHRNELKRLNQACWNGEEQKGLVRPQPLDVTARRSHTISENTHHEVQVSARSFVKGVKGCACFPPCPDPLRSSLAPGAEHFPVSFFPAPNARPRPATSFRRPHAPTRWWRPARRVRARLYRTPFAPCRWPSACVRAPFAWPPPPRLLRARDAAARVRRLGRPSDRPPRRGARKIPSPWLMACGQASSVHPRRDSSAVQRARRTARPIPRGA